MKTRFFLMLLTVAMLLSCEKAVFDDGLDVKGNETDANVVLWVSGFEQMNFDDGTAATRADQDVSELCSRLSFVVFSEDEKVKSINQKTGDDGFGQVALNLAEGTYQVVVIGHNCNGSATVSTTEKITFPDNVVSDTFYYYGDIEVGSTPGSYGLRLTRAVAMFRLVLTDSLPANVSKLKFYYTGGSSTFSAKSGYGCVNSRQTVTMAVAEGQQIFEVYTFPHEESGVLKMTVTALDDSDNTITEKVFENVPVTRNQITRYTGSLNGSSDNTPIDGVVRLTANADWDAVNDEVF